MDREETEATSTITTQHHWPARAGRAHGNRIDPSTHAAHLPARHEKTFFDTQCPAPTSASRNTSHANVDSVTC